MAEKKFRSWMGFRDEEERAPIANPVDRIRELESQLADLRSRRDITGLSREEFEILATETAMSMVKSAQAREVKARAASERIINETTRNAKDVLDGAENKARTILAGAEARGRKYISTAEAEGAEMLRDASRQGEGIIDNKRREAATLQAAARREAEKVVTEAAENVMEYRAWLADIISESERLYRSQSTALNAAEAAIAQSREKLDSAFTRLNGMKNAVESSLNQDGTVKRSVPIKVESKRTSAAIAAPKKTAKKATKKKPAKRK